MTATALEQLFKLFKSDLQVVVLNACHSDQKANAIANHIDFVVGMSDAIDDDAAIAFSTSFYRALAYGKTMQDAFDLACNEIALRGITGSDLPQLRTKAGIIPTTAILGIKDSTPLPSVQLKNAEVRGGQGGVGPGGDARVKGPKGGDVSIIGGTIRGGDGGEGGGKGGDAVIEGGGG